MRISDWSSDVCSSDLCGRRLNLGGGGRRRPAPRSAETGADGRGGKTAEPAGLRLRLFDRARVDAGRDHRNAHLAVQIGIEGRTDRTEEHTSELQSLMRNSYAVFCLKKNTKLLHK